MSRKVYVDVTAKIVINADEGVEISDVVDDFVNSCSGGDGYTIDVDEHDHEVTDSK